MATPPRSDHRNPGTGDATDAALDELILAARNTFVVLESHVELVEQAAQGYDERDPEAQRPGQADAARPADVEAEPPGDLAGWVRAVNAQVERAERAAAEAEQAAAGSGGWWSRLTACLGADNRMVTATLRVQGLTFGTGRPSFVPLAGGNQAWEELRERLDAAGQRATAACAGIERSEPGPQGLITVVPLTGHGPIPPPDSGRPLANRLTAPSALRP